MANRSFGGSGKTKTFVVNVTSAPGESWKGSILWVDGRCQQQFDNMQELLELMQSAIDEEQQTDIRE